MRAVPSHGGHSQSTPVHLDRVRTSTDAPVGAGVTGSDRPSVELICTALADDDCRRILCALGEPLSAADVASRCELPHTTTYRKLQQLTDAGLVDEWTDVRTDGNNVTRFVRDSTGVFVEFEDGSSFDVEVLDETDRPEQRLEQFWSRMREEL